DNVENLYIPLKDAEKYVENLENSTFCTAVEIPRGIFGTENQILTQLEKAKSLGFKAAYCSTLDAVALAKKAGFDVHTGFSMNVMNSLSEHELERLDVKSITLSPELTLDQLSKIGGDVKRGIIAYGRLPLMLTRNCPIKNVKSCSQCERKSFLTDRMGIRFPVVCTNGCSEILNSRPIYLADRLDEIKNIDFLTLYFTTESGSEVQTVLDSYRNKKSAVGEFTRGLYYRGVE
ncbi:MAG: U32 family peptidase, partial [Acutalibacteraceae bacterium]